MTNKKELNAITLGRELTMEITSKLGEGDIPFSQFQGYMKDNHITMDMKPFSHYNCGANAVIHCNIQINGEQEVHLKLYGNYQKATKKKEDSICLSRQIYDLIQKITANFGLPSFAV